MTDEQLTALAERFCATPLPATVCSDGCAVMPNYPHQRYGTNLLTVAEAKEMLAAVIAASPAYTPRPKIPAGMKAWAGGDSAPADWDGGKVLLRDGTLNNDGEYESSWCHNNSLFRSTDVSDLDIIAYTPRATSPTVPAIPVDREWLMVPVEPTEAMRGAGSRDDGVAYDHEHQAIGVHSHVVWSAMLAASPAYTPRPKIPAGMVRWNGGDSAPADWDGGRCAYNGYPGEIGTVSSRNSAAWRADSSHRVIAYTPRPVEGETDTVAFVQEWLMNADYDPTQFDKDFAAAIDARCAARPVEAGAGKLAEVERLREVLAEATPVPWRMEHGAISAHIHQVDGLHWLASCVIGHGDWHDPAQSRGVKDARLIVEAVNALPSLLAALTTPAGGIAEGGR
ncbi:hypothetical protein [Sphingomonas sp. 1P08PE]|uniref:hypothetical protein n=1 Tax=Sphingomonas sp. 1P08PE TaxID=554122 RepID=UPI00399F4BDB